MLVIFLLCGLVQNVTRTSDIPNLQYRLYFLELYVQLSSMHDPLKDAMLPNTGNCMNERL